MKRILHLFLLLTGYFTSAQTLTDNYEPYTQDIEENAMLSCFNDDGPSASSYFNFYHLTNYDIEGDTYEISSLEFGVENISGIDSYPITVRLYSTLQNFPEGFETLDGYTLLAEETYEVPAQQLNKYSVPITAEIPSNMRLLVELQYEEDLSGDVTMILGSNTGGSWGSTWTVSEDCGVTEPTTLATIAAMLELDYVPSLVMNVVGEGNLGLSGNTKRAFTLYPNPATDHVAIQSDETITSATIMDVSGKTIFEFTNTDHINVENLAAGVYYLKVEGFNGTHTGKFVKE